MIPWKIFKIIKKNSKVDFYISITNDGHIWIFTLKNKECQLFCLFDKSIISVKHLITIPLNINNNINITFSPDMTSFIIYNNEWVEYNAVQVNQINININRMYKSKLNDTKRMFEWYTSDKAIDTSGIIVTPNNIIKGKVSKYWTCENSDDGIIQHEKLASGYQILHVWSALQSRYWQININNELGPLLLSK